MSNSVHLVVYPETYTCPYDLTDFPHSIHLLPNATQNDQHSMLNFLCDQLNLLTKQVASMKIRNPLFSNLTNERFGYVRMNKISSKKLNYIIFT